MVRYRECHDWGSWGIAGIVLPLVLIVALGLGLGLTAYEFSPRVRARIDDYKRALQEAHASHREADAHLSNANTAARVAAQHAQSPVQPPEVPHTPQASPVSEASAASITAALMHAAKLAANAAVDHVLAATVANQQAAQSTAVAAKNSQTAVERRAAADSAVQVLERGKKIEEALSSLGIGQCGVRSYAGVTPQIRDTILAKLHAEGMVVTGDNPWDVDTQQAGVKLRAAWDSRTQVLKLIVTASAFFAPCGVIWEKIDPKLRGIIEGPGVN